MSELINRASILLHERWKAAHRKSIEAPETYSKLVLDPEGDPALAEVLVDAMDEMGIGAKELAEDVVHLKLARKVVPRIQANREAIRRAYEDIRAAELALHEAQARRCPQPIERAHYELAEAAGRAADAEREGRALLQELRERAHRAPRLVRGHVELIERAMAEADQRREQKAAESKASAAPATVTDVASVPEAKTEVTSGGGGNGKASRQVAAAASHAVRQMMGQPNEENWLAPGLIRFPGNLGKA